MKPFLALTGRGLRNADGVLHVRVSCSSFSALPQLSLSLFLAPTGAQGEAMSCVRVCVRDIIRKNVENEF